MHFRFLAAAAIAAALPAMAGTIISETAGAESCCRVVTGYASWSQSVTYTNVSIYANLFSVNSPTPATGIAYLVSQVGPGTTSADEYVSPFNISLTTGTSTPTLLFSGLTLAPGDYFLVIHPTSELEWDNGVAAPVRVLGTGVTVSATPEKNQGTIDPYAPASNFTQTGGLIYSVTGDLASEVPEPATGALILAGAGLLWLGRKRF